MVNRKDLGTKILTLPLAALITTLGKLFNLFLFLQMQKRLIILTSVRELKELCKIYHL